MRSKNASLEWEQEGMRLRLVYQPEAAHPAQMAEAQAAVTNEGQSGAERLLIEVRAPVVGIFYAAPAPDRPPFVEIGTVVERGSPLCIVEAMKLLNEVTAPCAGRIVEIGGENGVGVEYGQILFRIQPENANDDQA